MTSNQNEPSKSAKKSSSKKKTTDKASETTGAGEFGMNDLKKKAFNAGAEVRNYFTSASKNLDDVAHDIEGNIRKEPVKASLIALGVGFFIGLLSRRS